MLLAAEAASAARLPAQSERRALDGARVGIHNVAGRVTVESGTGSDVVVEVTRGGRDASRLRVETSTIDGRNTLSIVYPDDDIIYPGAGERRWNSEFTIGDGARSSSGRLGRERRVRVRSSGDGTEAWADLRVLVPRGKSVNVELGVGQLDVTRVEADLDLDVAAARVTITGTRGRLDVDAGSGGIDLRDVQADNLDVDNGSGGVRFSGVSGSTCRIDTGSGGVTGDRIDCRDVTVESGSGSIRLDDVKASRATVESGSGSVRLVLRSAPSVLSVESGSGSVTLGMPADIGAEVDIRTGSGGIQSDFSLRANRVERHRLRGRIGDGSGRINVESGSGSVQLRRN